MTADGLSPAAVLGQAADAVGPPPLATVEAVARGVFDALDRRDLPAVAGYLHPDDEQDFVPLRRVAGRAAVVEVFAELFRSFPDLTITVEDVAAVHDRAYVRWHAAGTFTGERYQGLLATGKRVGIRGVDAFIQVVDGLIRHNTIFYDGAAFAREIGALPARGSLAERVVVGLVNTRTRIDRLVTRLALPLRGLLGRERRATEQP